MFRGLVQRPMALQWGLLALRADLPRCWGLLALYAYLLAVRGLCGPL